MGSDILVSVASVAIAAGLLFFGMPDKGGVSPRFLRFDAAPINGGRGLLLQSLVEFLFQVRVGCAKAFNVSSRLRSGRTKTTNAGLALRTLARQGHLVGTVTGPFRVGGPPAPGMEAAILTEPHRKHSRRSFSSRCLG